MKTRCVVTAVCACLTAAPRPACGAPARGATGPVGAPVVANRDAPPIDARELTLPTRSALEIFYDRFVKERLSIGLSHSFFTLEETERPADRDGGRTFLGYINTLEPVKRTTPQWVVAYNPIPYLGFQYTRDEVAARTRNYNNDLSDGVVRMSGPIYTVTMRVPLFGFVCPYVGISYAPWKGAFEHAEWWRLGWPSPEAYRAAGSPGTSAGMLRTIAVEDDTARFYTLGVTLTLHRHVAFDIAVRKLELDTPARFQHTFGALPTEALTGDFPLSHTSWTVALRAVF